MSQHHKVLIIGSGPAGLTAAIYTARAGLSPLSFEGEPSSTSDQPGGQLMLTTEVENFPGFPEGIMGPELMMRCREQATRFGAAFITEKVTKVDFSSQPLRAWVRDTEYTADSVIVSTGAQSLMLGLPEEQRLIGHGLSTCATCDGFFFRGQEIAVVGGGDSALEEAQFLTKFASKVHMIVRRDAFRGSKIMQQRAFNNEKISIIWNSSVTQIHGEDKVSGVQLTDTATGVVSELPVTVCLSQLDIDQTPICLRVYSRWKTLVILSPHQVLLTPTFLVCLRAEMFRITHTDKQLQLLVRAAWPHSTVSAG